MSGCWAESEQVHPFAETKVLDDKKNPMDPVNIVHRYFKRFIHRHGGYLREGLQGWLDLSSYWMNAFGTPFDKARNLLA